MKRNNVPVCMALLLMFVFSACASKTTDAVDLLTEVKTAQFFTEEKIADADVEKILSAGVNAPSAINTQPWHFTAVTDDVASSHKTSAPRASKIALSERWKNNIRRQTLIHSCKSGCNNPIPSGGG